MFEQQGNAPQGGEADKGVDHAGDRRGLSAAYPCDYVELEQTDAAPVDTADYRENKCDAIYYHGLLSSSLCGFPYSLPALFLFIKKFFAIRQK